MRWLMLLIATQALALSDEPPTLEYVTWNECVEIDCYVSPEYPVLTSYNPVFLGTIVQRGPSPATISDLCETAFGASQPFGTPIHGMTIQVFATEADSGLCADPPPSTLTDDPVDDGFDEFDRQISELEAKLQDDEPTSFDPPEGFVWP